MISGDRGRDAGGDADLTEITSSSTTDFSSTTFFPRPYPVSLFNSEKYTLVDVGAGLHNANTFCRISFLDTRPGRTLINSSPSPVTDASLEVEGTEIAVSGLLPSFLTSLYIFI